MRIDLNADLGESFGAWRMGDDAALLDVVTSANVACGFHAGDPRTMLATVRLAAERGVTIGAHVSYRDLAGFGRRFLDVDPADLYADTVYQLGALAGACRVAGTTVAYVKPHGALYNAIVHHEAQAQAVVAAIRDFDPALVLLGLPGAALRLAAEVGLRTAVEAFADRAYRPDGSLAPRGEPDAVLTDPHQIADRVVHLVTTGQIPTSAGPLTVAAESVCVHGDTPGAVAIARRIRERLAAAGVEIAGFVA
jgi:UPF0271 protein